MHRTIAAVVLALSIAGCGFSDPKVDITKDLNNNTNCAPDVFLSGAFVYQPSLGIVDDHGTLLPVIWPSSFKIEWRSGFSGHYEVRNDAGRVVAVTGGHYRFAGTWFNGLNEFWACSDITPM